MTSKTITGIVSWLRGWFYTKDEIITKESALQTQINNKASQSDLNTLSSNVANKLDASAYVVDSALSSSSTNPVQNKVVDSALGDLEDALSGKSDTGHTHDDRYYTESEVDDLLDDKLDSSAYVVDSALSSSSTNPVQNKAINTALSSKASQSDLNTLSSTVANKLDASDYVVDSALSSTSENPVQNKVVDTALSAKAQVNHCATTTLYGVGNASYYGHNKVINNLTTSSYVDGNSLSAYQGYVLKGLIDAKSDFSGSYDDLTDVPSSFTPSPHSHEDTVILVNSDLPYIGIHQGQSQEEVNQSIDYLIGQLTHADIIKVVTTLPSESASTMNTLYLLRSDGQYDIYITIEDNGSYSWEKLDDDVLSDLSIDWSDIENKPSSFTPSSHSHGYITNDGKITNTVPIASSDKIVITDGSDSSIVKRVDTILSTHMHHVTSLNNIGTSANALQSDINININTKLGKKAEKSEVIDWDSLTFVAKADDETGAITFDYLE